MPTTYHARIVHPHDQDALSIVVCRYQDEQQHYLGADGDWHPYQGFDIIQPAATFPGFVGDAVVRAMSAYAAQANNATGSAP